MKSENKAYYLLACLVIVTTITSMISISFEIVFASVSKDRLVQIPSEPSDFIASDPNLSDFRVLKADKNMFGGYQIEGQIINLSDKALHFPKPIVYLFDSDNEPIGRILNGMVATTLMPAQTITTFQISINPSELLGDPTYYKLGFKGTFSKD